MFRKTIRRLAVLAAAPLAVAGIGIAGASVANASVLAQYQAVSDGTAGYYAINSTKFHSVQATVETSPAAVNIGGLGQGGIGTQLCDPNNGFGLQLGLVSNGATFSVEYAAGTLAGAAADACVGNGVLPASDAHVLSANLTGLPQGDFIQLNTKFKNVHVSIWHPGWRGSRGHWHPGHWTRQWEGRVTFQAYDESGFEIYTSPWIATAADFNLDNAGAGVQQDTTGMSSCTPATLDSHYAGNSGACNAVAYFSQVGVNGSLGDPDTGFTTFNTVEVVTTGGGIKANVAVVAPNGSISPTGSTSENSFCVFAGEVLV